MSTDRVSLERSIRACYSTWAERYYADYYEGEGAYPPVHIEIVRDLLAKAGSKSVLDAGCGPASMLRALEMNGLERFGFDLTPEMVAEARVVLSRQGVPESHIWQGSVLDTAPFDSHAARSQGQFDAAVCFGVLPHIPADADRTVLQNLHDAVRPGGFVAVEARNALFALFSLNRYSRAFFRDSLVDEAGLCSRSGDEAGALDAALKEIDDRFRLDLPPVRKGHANEPGYDEVLSRTHVPMELQRVAENAGLEEVRLLFYHYHALPPMLEAKVPKLFRRESLRMENPTDWRGYVMASAFILVGQRPVT
jgi:SAM-dependent methyltransferase